MLAPLCLRTEDETFFMNEFTIDTLTYNAPRFLTHVQGPGRTKKCERTQPYGEHVFTRATFPCITLDRNTSKTMERTWPRYTFGIREYGSTLNPAGHTGVVKIVRYST